MMSQIYLTDLCVINRAQRGLLHTTHPMAFGVCCSWTWSIALRANTHRSVIAICPRPLPRKVTNHEMPAMRRVWAPKRDERYKPSHASQARDPPNSRIPVSHTELHSETGA